MNPSTDILVFAPLKDKTFHFAKFILFPRFEATRVVKDKSRVATKYELVLDDMFTSLTSRVSIGLINFRETYFSCAFDDRKADLQKFKYECCSS